MPNFVLDSSVIIAGLVPENKSSLCRDYLQQAVEGKATLYSPEYARIEIANVLWKYYERNQLTAGEINILWENITALPIQWISHTDLLYPAIEISLKYHITIYDAIYVITAEKFRYPLITLDSELSKKFLKSDITVKLL